MGRLYKLLVKCNLRVKYDVFAERIVFTYSDGRHALRISYMGLNRFLTRYVCKIEGPMADAIRKIKDE